MLRAYHSKEELFALFSPVLRKNDAFRLFVLQNYKAVSGVEDFASLANMSVRSFQRRFKASFGCSLREWLVARKSEQLLQEIRSSEKSLTDIAAEFGFTGMSYFATFCKNNLGKTPTELRASSTEKQEIHDKAL